MGAITDAVEEFAGKIVDKGIGIIAAKIGGWIADKIFGDAADDSDREATARAILEKGVEFAADRARNKVAAGMLAGRVNATMRDIAALDVRALFTPDGSVVDTGVDVETTVQLTSISWGIVQTHLKAANIQPDSPTDGERDNLGALARVLGMLIVSSDVDRNVPPRIQSIIDAG